MLEIRAVRSEGSIFGWRTIAAPKRHSFNPDGGRLGNGDGNAIGNVATFSDFHAGGIAEGDSLVAGRKRLDVSLPVGLIIDHPSCAGFAVRLSPRPLSDCH